MVLPKILLPQFVNKAFNLFDNQSFVTITYCLPLNYMDPVNTLTFCFFKISFNIIPSSLPGPPGDHPSCGFPHVKFVYEYNL